MNNTLIIKDFKSDYKLYNHYLKSLEVMKALDNNVKLPFSTIITNTPKINNMMAKKREK